MDELPLPLEKVTPATEVAMCALGLLRRYHQHTVVGAEHVPTEGPALVVTNHSLATYDGFLLGLALYQANGRVPAGLADDLLFQLPLVRDVARGLGMMPASPASGERLLRAGRLVYLAPGGMHEALRPRAERYRVRWARRKGFVRLALRAGAPIVLAACPAADDLFTVYPSALTDAAYERLKLPLPLFRGFGPTLLPRPVVLTHYVQSPIQPPVWDPAREVEQVNELHASLVARMSALMERAA